MDSQGDNIDRPTDSLFETTTNLPFRHPPLPAVAFPQPRATRLFPNISKERFLMMMSKFYDKTSGNEYGFRPEDFSYVVNSVRRGRHRGGRPDGLYFSENPARRSIVDHFVQRLQSDCFPMGNLSPERCELLNSATCWAFLQVANMGEMESIKTMLLAPAMPKLFDEIEEIFIAWSLQFRIFFNRPLRPPGVSRLSMMLYHRRNRPDVDTTYEARNIIKQKCLNRDNERCIITKTPHPEVAYIYPIRAINSPERETLRIAVATIWGQAPADEIYYKLFGHGIDGIDCLGNVICMSPNFRAAWERGEFILYPRRAERDPEKGGWKMELVFYWLVKVHCFPDRPLGLGFRWSAAQELRDKGKFNLFRGVRAINVENHAPVIDSDIITVRASQKEELPDYDILMLQYDILRMASLCGGAEPDKPDEEENYRSSDEFGAATTPEETEDSNVEDAGNTAQPDYVQ